ncbi:MAG TPA: PIG-L family deacetylase [Thermoanaerobaculia bacterium]|nr:PIG-L family deacetylase [Thermoanaerobaculia bacterium]
MTVTSAKSAPALALLAATLLLAAVPAILGGRSVLALPTPVNLGPSPFEPASTGGAATLDRALAKLSTHKRLLVIGAHPDDEDTSLLALVARGMGGEAAYLSLSRGEGGQDLIGPELGVGLGLIRSRELLAARAIDGGRQFFSRAYDFGFTMSLEETLGQWPKEVLVEDTIRVMRRFKPQVVVSIFPGVPVKTHGQHQASGIAAFAAFPLAGDASALPQLRAEGLAPWAPQALFRKTWFDPQATTLKLPLGGIDPWSGKSAFQLAMASRGMHRSQGMGLTQELGAKDSALGWVSGGAGAAAKDLFDGIDTHLRAIARPLADPVLRSRVAAELEAVEGLAVRARATLNPERPEALVPDLVEAVRHLRAAAALLAPAGGRPDQKPVAELIAEKLEVAEIALASAAGVALDATTPREALVAGESFPVAATLWNSGSRTLAAVAVTLAPAPEWHGEPVAGEAKELAQGGLQKWELKAVVPAAAPPTMPYFLRLPLSGGLYDWSAAAAGERGEPFGPPPLIARFNFSLDGVPVTLEREVVHLHRNEVLGEVRRPLRVVPLVEVAVAESVQIWPLSRHEPRGVRVVVTSHAKAALRGRLEVASAPAAGGAAWPAVPPRSFEIPAPDPAADEAEGEQLALPLTLQPPAALAPGRYPLRLAAVLEDGARFDLAVPVIDYAHIHPTPNPRHAAVEVTATDLKLPPLERVGYVRGVSDEVPEFLRQAGVPLELLGPGELAGADLTRYDAIVIGSRAYESEPALARFNHRLLDYVRGGGLMIVQYQQYAFIESGFAPFKLEIARPHDRVTDETAAVTLLDLADPVFSTPNRIAEADWQGWVQERGLYFAHSWDPAYKPLLAMADPGGPQQRGALLAAAYGKGKYVYTGLALFRQLPAGVPGAYRLFANLLALGRK